MQQIIQEDFGLLVRFKTFWCPWRALVGTSRTPLALATAVEVQSLLVAESGDAIPWQVLVRARSLGADAMSAAVGRLVQTYC